MAADYPVRAYAGRDPNDIANTLRAAIVDGVYQPGHRLVQEELADRFGVSRIPLREAIRTLIGEGLVRSQSGRGTFVVELDLTEIDEIYDLRKLVEPSFAEHVVHRVSRAELIRLTQMAADMDRIDTLGADGWSRINFGFHLDMYRLAGLPIRYEVISRLYHRLEPYSRFYVHGTQAHERVQGEHHAMIDALTAGDSNELAKQIRIHIDGGQQGLHTAWHTRADYPVETVDRRATDQKSPRI